MFDYVPKAKYDEEVAARIKAETARDLVTAENARLIEALNTERAAQREEAFAYRQDLRSLLDRFAPIVKDPVAEAGGVVTLEEQLDMVRHRPAFGVADMQQKRLDMSDLMRQIRTKTHGADAPDPGELSEGEIARVEEVAG